jgi:4-hydroxy-tetrahydrodipicolinate reductase
MTIHILINGAQGKMGQETVKAVSEHSKDFTLVAKTGRNDNLTKSIREFKPQVVIDFTNADAAFKNTQAIIEAGVHPVIGTSGFLKNQIALLQKRCVELKLGGIIVPNFSLGAVLMMKCAKEISRHFSMVEIIEAHHTGKLDSPSSTAMRTAELITSSRAKEPQFPTSKETLSGARGANYGNIPIHSLRLPGIIANQEVIFGAPGETLSIKHMTIDRQCFMPGVLLACKKVMELDRLVYGLEELI